jgi:Family of unknown function (DUF6785)/Domain of unknown function (DUF6784)
VAGEHGELSDPNGPSSASRREPSVAVARPSSPPPSSLTGITARALTVSVLLIFATYLGITRTGFIRINWVPYVIPPVPALLFLLLLEGLNLLLRQMARIVSLPSFLRPFTRGELFLIYAAVAISLSMDRAGYVIHYLLFAQYYGDPVNRFGELFSYYPAYYVPHDPGVIARWFEGSPTGRIPWAAWWTPLAWWSAFSLVLMFAVMCLAALFRRQWVENERLTFPLLFLPLEVAGGRGRESVTRGFFRSPIMWIGFSAGALYNAINILHAFFPTIPGLPWIQPIDTGMTEGPWRHARPLAISFGLEVWGLSFLASGEALFSGWFFYLFIKVVKVIGREAGYLGAGFPYYQELSAGACIAFAAYMVWVGREHLRDIGRGLTGQRVRGDEGEPFSARFLGLGLLASTAILIGMMLHAGQNLTLMLIYFGTLFMYVLIAARIRAEIGPPVAWNHPYGFDQQTPVHLMGTKAITRLAGPQGTTLFYALFWIGRTIFAHSAAQYQIDGLRLADFGGVKRRSIVLLMLLACVVGLGLTWWYHLDVGYRFGQGLIGEKTGRAGQSWAFSWSRGQYNLLDQALRNPQAPQVPTVAAYGIGFLAAGLMTFLRARFAAFPFHPVGFILGTLYGDSTPYWFAFLFAWTAQRITLRYGGLTLYRKVVPAFLGLAFAHILIGGILWRIITNYFIDPTISIRYYLNIGG